MDKSNKEQINYDFPDINDNSIYEIIRGNLSFFIPYSLFLLFGAVLIVLLDRGDVLLYINQYHSPLLDWFFYYVTIIGDGWFVGVVLVPLGFIRLRYSVQLLASYLTTGGLVQILKRLFDMPRPIKYFGEGTVLNFVQGIEVHKFHSFPSGHSASAFSLFLVAAIIVRNKAWGIVFFFAALTVAVSRVYDVQHFFVDIYFGSLIGVLITLLTYRLVELIGIKKRIRWMAPYNPPV